MLLDLPEHIPNLKVFGPKPDRGGLDEQDEINQLIELDVSRNQNVTHFGELFMLGLLTVCLSF